MDNFCWKKTLHVIIMRVIMRLTTMKCFFFPGEVLPFFDKEIGEILVFLE
jgi:hypothetical protein